MCINKTQIFASQTLVSQMALENLLKEAALTVSRRKEALCTLNHDWLFATRKPPQLEVTAVFIM